MPDENISRIFRITQTDPMAQLSFMRRFGPPKRIGSMLKEADKVNAERIRLAGPGEVPRLLVVQIAAAEIPAWIDVTELFRQGLV